MRSANAEISTNLSVGNLSTSEAPSWIPSNAADALADTAALARSTWLRDAERATEKNKNSEKQFCDPTSNQPRRETRQAVARAPLCQTWRWPEFALAPPQSPAGGQTMQRVSQTVS